MTAAPKRNTVAFYSPKLSPPRLNDANLSRITPSKYFLPLHILYVDLFVSCSVFLSRDSRLSVEFHPNQVHHCSIKCICSSSIHELTETRPTRVICWRLADIHQTITGIMSSSLFFKLICGSLKFSVFIVDLHAAPSSLNGWN